MGSSAGSIHGFGVTVEEGGEKVDLTVDQSDVIVRVDPLLQLTTAAWLKLLVGLVRDAVRPTVTHVAIGVDRCCKHVDSLD